MLPATQSRNSGCSQLWKHLTTTVQTAAANNKLSITLDPSLFEKHADCAHLSKMKTLGYHVVFSEVITRQHHGDKFTTAFVGNTTKIGWGTKAPKATTYPRWWHFWKNKSYTTSYIFNNEDPIPE